MALESRFSDVLGATVHWTDYGGPPAPAAVLVCVHGLGGCAANWDLWGPLMARTHRVVALDLVGFGLTEAGQRQATVAANTELLTEFLRTIHARTGHLDADLPVLLVGNSMGGLIAANVISTGGARPAGLVLVNPAAPHVGYGSALFPVFGLPYAGEFLGLALYGTPFASALVAQYATMLRSPEQTANDLFWMCVQNQDTVTQSLIDKHAGIIAHQRGRRGINLLFAQAAHSTVSSIAGAKAPVIFGDVDVPVLLAHGTQDRLVPYAGAVRLAHQNPQWDFATAPGAGHFLMVERPQWLADLVNGWVRGLGRPGPG